MLKKSQNKEYNAIRHLQAGVNLGDVVWHGCLQTTINRLWVHYNTRSTCDRPGSGWDWYIPLMHLQDRIRRATSRVIQMPGLKQISSQTVFSRHIISMNELGGVKNIFCENVHSREQFSFQWIKLMLFRSDRCSRIYWYHNERYASHSFGSVLVWAGIHHDGHIALMRVNGVLSAHIFQHNNARPQTAHQLWRFSTAKHLCFTMTSRFIPNRILLEHPGTVLGFTE